MVSHDQADQEKGPEITLAADEQVNYAQRPKCFSSTLQECLFVLTATMAIGQQSFFSGCIVGVTASIGADLKMNSAEITWINAGASYVHFLINLFTSKPYPMSIERRNPMANAFFRTFTPEFANQNPLTVSAVVPFY
jgi:ABC-type methionine transport system permease subunit